ncbi:MAG: hypothetical protein NUV77_16670, partial [Thermoguttaceae bacterium]|nr:hypothetical protein [Thermoguttaceae bacterium]
MKVVLAFSVHGACRLGAAWLGALVAVALGGSVALPVSRAAEMAYPVSTAARDGRFYVADQDLPGIWLLAEGRREVFFQASKKYRTPLNAVRCVAIDTAGNLLAGDAATSDVYRFPKGEKGSKPEPLTGGKVGVPVDLAVDKQGNVFVSDAAMNCVWKLAPDAKRPEKLASVTGPRGLAAADDGTVWALSLRENPLLKIAPDGTTTALVKGRPFEFPNDVAVDQDGTLYVSDGYASAVWKVTPSGEVAKWISGKPLVRPLGLTWHEGRLLITDPAAKNIFRADYPRRNR